MVITFFLKKNPDSTGVMYKNLFGLDLGLLQFCKANNCYHQYQFLISLHVFHLPRMVLSEKSGDYWVAYEKAALKVESQR